MFLARIDGTVTSAHKHASLAGARFLIAHRLEADGTASGDPLVIVDWLGAALHDAVIVSTDGDIARQQFSNDVPARMVVVGLVDRVANGGSR